MGPLLLKTKQAEHVGWECLLELGGERWWAEVAPTPPQVTAQQVQDWVWRQKQVSLSAGKAAILLPGKAAFLLVPRNHPLRACSLGPSTS